MSQNEKYFGNWIILFESNDNENSIEIKLYKRDTYDVY